MHRSSPGRPLTATPCFSSSALSSSYVPVATLRVEIVARREGSIASFLEQRHPLLAGVQEDLAVAFSVDGHAEDVGVERPGPFHVRHMEHDVVDPVGLDHLVSPASRTTSVTTAIVSNTRRW
jgi:hypothetical protein